MTGHGPHDRVAWRDAAPIAAAAFRAHVAAAAQRLPAAGAVLNLCSDRYLFAVVLCAALSRGRLTVLPPAATPHMLDAVREAAEPSCWAGEAVEGVPGLPRVDLDGILAAQAQAPALPAIAPGQPAVCLFTSGSTGAPQAHLKTWGSLVRGARATGRRLGITPRHAVLGTVPPQHMYGLETTVMLPLVHGAALCAGRPFYPADLDAAVAALPAPRVLFTTPFHLRAWVEADPAGRPESIVCATAPLAASLAREAEARTGATLLEIYGSTETGVAATRRTACESDWRLLDGLELSVQAEAARLAGGHLDRPQPLHDVIELLGEGRFRLHGRSADMVNVAGKRSSLAYLDRQLAEIPGVVDGAFVLPEEPAPGAVARLAALVVAPGLPREAILAALRERIDAAFLPRPLVRVDALPRLATGKLPRESLLRLLAGSRAAGGGS